MDCTMRRKSLVITLHKDLILNFRFDKSNNSFDDYNTLIRVTSELDPAKESQQWHVTEIDASDSCVSGFGCRHFGKTFQSLIFGFRRLEQSAFS